MRYKITTKPSGYIEFPVSVYINGKYLDDFPKKPSRKVAITVYKEMKMEGVL